MHRNRGTMSTEIDRLIQLAKEDPQRRFCSIAHLLTLQRMHAAMRDLRKKASAGVDGVTYWEYARFAEANIQDLHARVKAGQYRAQPLKRIYIPKGDGQVRPISIPTLEDKILQRAVTRLLSPIYEQDFLDCSCGFRPGRSPHDALEEVSRVIRQTKTNYVLEADIVGYFDAIVKEALMELLGKRISDGSIRRLIGKWLRIGVIDDGRLLTTKTGVGQGQTISPLLANVYLHYVLDEWFETEVKPRLRGEAYEIRYCDDFILCFQYREDAERVLEVLAKRFAKYGLTLHSEKTRLLEFGRYAQDRAKRRGEKKAATFDFLGLTHVCARSRRGFFTVHRRTMKQRLQRSLKAVSQWCRCHMHDPVEDQRQALNKKLEGHYQYYGVSTNYRSLVKYFRAVCRTWKRWLNRRTRGQTMNWARFSQLLRRHPLSLPRITHSWTSERSPA